METVIGVDASLTHTGVVVLRGAGTIPLEARVTGSEKGRLRDVPRYKLIRDALRQVFQTCQPDVVAIEAPIFASSSAFASESAAVQLVAREALWDYNTERLEPARFLSVNPAHVKKWLGVKEKAEVLLQVYKQYAQEYTDHNLADAYVIATIARAVSWPDRFPAVNQKQREVVGKLQKDGWLWEQPLVPAKGRKKV